jgi:hypothetical protein
LTAKLVLPVQARKRAQPQLFCELVIPCCDILVLRLIFEQLRAKEQNNSSVCCQITQDQNFTFGLFELHYVSRQQPKGGDPVSHCQLSQSPVSEIWTLACVEFRPA